MNSACFFLSDSVAKDRFVVGGRLESTESAVVVLRTMGATEAMLGKTVWLGVGDGVAEARGDEVVDDSLGDPGETGER